MLLMSLKAAFEADCALLGTIGHLIVMLHGMQLQNWYLTTDVQYPPCIKKKSIGAKKTRRHILRDKNLVNPIRHFVLFKKIHVVIVNMKVTFHYRITDASNNLSLCCTSPQNGHNLEASCFRQSGEPVLSCSLLLCSFLTYFNLHLKEKEVNKTFAQRCLADLGWTIELSK